MEARVHKEEIIKDIFLSYRESSLRLERTLLASPEDETHLKEELSKTVQHQLVCLFNACLDIELSALPNILGLSESAFHAASLLFVTPVDDMVLSMSRFFAKYTALLQHKDASSTHNRLGPFPGEMLPFISCTVRKHLLLICHLMQTLCAWPEDIYDFFLIAEADIESMTQPRVVQCLTSQWGSDIASAIVADKSRQVNDLHKYLQSHSSYSKDRIDLIVRIVSKYDSIHILRLGKRPRDD